MLQRLKLKACSWKVAGLNPTRAIVVHSNSVRSNLYLKEEAWNHCENYKSLNLLNLQSIKFLVISNETCFTSQDTRGKCIMAVFSFLGEPFLIHSFRFPVKHTLSYLLLSESCNVSLHLHINHPIPQQCCLIQYSKDGQNPIFFSL